METSQAYIHELKERYYKGWPVGDVDLDAVVFATSPQSGAEIFISDI